MTRQDILTQAKDMLQEVQGDPQADFPQGWGKIISQAADQIARHTDCNYATVTAPIVNGQSLYCSPEVYKVKAVSCYLADGSRRTLQPSTIPAMDDWSSTWRDETAQASPRLWIPMGLNKFVLYPAPNYDSAISTYADLAVDGANNKLISSVARPFIAGDVNMFVQVTGGTGWTVGFYRIVSVAGGKATLITSPGAVGITLGAATLTSGGLAIEGYATFGTGTASQAWDARNAPCPLPARAHYLCVLKACLMRIMQNPTDLNLRRRQFINEEYKDELGNLETEVRRFAASTASPSYTGGDEDGSDYSPLDMY